MGCKRACDFSWGRVSKAGKKNVENVESSERASEASRGELETFSTFFFPLCSRDALETPGKITCARAAHKTYIASKAENEFEVYLTVLSHLWSLHFPWFFAKNSRDVLSSRDVLDTCYLAYVRKVIFFYHWTWFVGGTPFGRALKNFVEIWLRSTV